jgi:hypothetical protein
LDKGHDGDDHGGSDSGGINMAHDPDPYGNQMSRQYDK